MDVQKTFEFWAGDGVRYVGHIKESRQISIRYTIPASPEPDDVRLVHCHLRNGLNSTLHLAIKRIAASAQGDAYVRSGQYQRDMTRLQAGKLA